MHCICQQVYPSSPRKSYGFPVITNQEPQAVSEQQPLPNSSPEALQPVTGTVNIAGKNIGLELQTSSTISRLLLEQEQKKISFTVSGIDGTEGTTIIPIGKILDGPYLVSLDGVPTDNYQIIYGDSPVSMKIWYTHSTHTIAISGTNVVPEFPAITLVIISALVMPILLGRRYKHLGGNK